MSAQTLEVAASQRRPGIPRVESTLLTLACCLPFCSPARLPPDPAFWGEWASALLFSLWMSSRLGLQQAAGARLESTVSWVAVVFFGAAALVIAQVALRSVRSPVESLVTVAILFLAGSVCVSATSTLNSGERQDNLQPAAWGLLIAFLANAAATLMALGGYGFYGFELTQVAATPRSVGLIGQPNHLGMLAVMAIASAAHLRSIDRLPGWAWPGIVISAALVCAMSGSRMAVVAWILMAAMAWWHGRGSPSGHARVPMTTARGLAGVLFALFMAQIAWVQWSESMSTPGFTVARSNLSARYEIVRDGVLIGLQHPLFGTGNGNFATARLFELTESFVLPEADNAHNLPVHAWAEWGIPGLLIVAGAMLLLISATLRRGSPSNSTVNETLYPSTIVLCLLAYSMVEHPFWFVNLLLPFAFFAGMLGLPAALKLPMPPSGRRMGKLAIAATLAGAAVVAVDYLRLQSLAVRAAEQGIGAPDLVSRDSLAEISRIATATLFPTEAAILQCRSLAYTTDYAELKFEISERALRGVPGGETAARYVAFSGLAGRSAAGLALLDRLASRNPRMYRETLKNLELLSVAHPLIADVLNRHLATIPRP